MVAPSTVAIVEFVRVHSVSDTGFFGETIMKVLSKLSILVLLIGLNGQAYAQRQLIKIDGVTFAIPLRPY